MPRSHRRKGTKASLKRLNDNNQFGGHAHTKASPVRRWRQVRGLARGYSVGKAIPGVVRSLFRRRAPEEFVEVIREEFGFGPSVDPQCEKRIEGGLARLIRHLRSALPEYLTRLLTRSPREELSEQLLDRLLPAQVWVLVQGVKPGAHRLRAAAQRRCRRRPEVETAGSTGAARALYPGTGPDQRAARRSPGRRAAEARHQEHPVNKALQTAHEGRWSLIRPGAERRESI